MIAVGVRCCIADTQASAKRFVLLKFRENKVKHTSPTHVLTYTTSILMYGRAANLQSAVVGNAKNLAILHFSTKQVGGRQAKYILMETME